ncbi:MAG: histidine phosphatase family protein [Chloroflexota bacterium]
MSRLILVRHGQTEWNRVERFRGRIDLPLNETGIWQAEQAARTIGAKYRVAAIYSSPLSRAMRTAEAIWQAVGKAVQVLPALNDFSYGEWEGKSPEEVAVAYPEVYRLWQTQPHLASIPGGESLAGLRDRAAAAVEEIAAMHPAETVVMVSHRMVCKVLACYLLGLENSHLWRVDLDTASISLFEKREAGWTTLLLNDTCHLDARQEV